VKGISEKYRSINIQLTEKCNLSCPYCFAGTTDGESVSMDSNDVRSIVVFCQENEIKSVKITGGEPFLYPYATDVINNLVTFTNVTVLSNLTIDNCLTKIAAPSSIALLVNVNDKEQYTKSQYETFCTNLEYAISHGFDIVLGKTMYREPFDCSNIIELCVKNGLKNMRLSHASPSNRVRNVWLDSKALSGMYRYIYEIRKELVSKGINVIFDCPVCACKIDKDVFETLNALWGISTHCKPRISITSRMTLESCYSTKGMVGGLPFESFSTFIDMADYMESDWNTMSAKMPNDCGCSDNCEQFIPGSFCGCPSALRSS
jgi:MoaA/NifB/PqqE/SkfB family radical SAM enzyme